jgi:FkbM family methyltransferase
MLKKLLANFIFDLLGCRATYRLGRSMYLYARGDIINNMKVNGEMLIQSGVLAAREKNLITTSRLTIFDVGANVGEWSFAMIDGLRNHNLVMETDLFAFEPVPSTAETLKRNLSPREACLHIEEIALSSSNGEVEIYFAGSNSGTNSLYADSMPGKKESTTIKQTTSIQFCKERGIHHIHLLKCDTEGHDMEVIRGALPLLQEKRISVLQFEYNHRWIYSRNFLRDVFLIVEMLPYKILKLQQNYLLTFEKWHPELDKFFEGNYAIIHDDALTWFATKQGIFDDTNSLIIT